MACLPEFLRSRSCLGCLGYRLFLYVLEGTPQALPSARYAKNRIGRQRLGFYHHLKIAIFCPTQLYTRGVIDLGF